MMKEWAVKTRRTAAEVFARNQLRSWELLIWKCRTFDCFEVKCEQKVKLLFHLQSSLKLHLPLSFNFTIEFIHSADISIIELGD